MRLWRNYPVHNLVAHPLMEVLHWVRLDHVGTRIHDATLPKS